MTSRLSGRLPALARATAFVLLLGPVCLLLLPQLATPSPESNFQDDLFYYLVAARNVVAGHGSTFDGMHATNGYHPLWMVVCVALVALFHGKALFIALTVLQLAAVLLTSLLVERILRTYAGAATAALFAALAAVLFAAFTGGMETTLATPVLFGLVLFRLRRFRWTPASGLVYGLLGSATVLSRLDAALFVLPLALLDLLLARGVRWSDRWKATAGFLTGALPVAVYLIWNRVAFGSALPVSSQAKQLRLHSGFLGTKLLMSVVLLEPGTHLLIKLTIFLLVPAVLLLAFRGFGRIRPEHRAVLCALLLFAPLHLLILSFVSDWPIWPWYCYSILATAVGAALALLARQERWIVPAYRYAALVPLVLLLRVDLHLMKGVLVQARDPGSYRNAFFAAATDLRDFGTAHPGLYAMGDRAGMVGYFSPNPVLQTEGLMMDRPFLDNLRQQRNLLAVLRGYGVRYFIATNPLPDGACVVVREPAMAGPDTPAMWGRFCSQPLHEYLGSTQKRNMVFDLEREADTPQTGLPAAVGR